MRKFFLGAALSATIIAGNMAPVLANLTNINTDGEVTAHSVEVNSDLVEIEGRTLTDAEAAEVEGEAWWGVVGFAVSLSVGNGATTTLTHYGDCRHKVRTDCSSRAYGRSFVSGATFGIWR